MAEAASCSGAFASFRIAAVGAIVAIAFGKMVFGGFGMNVFNPALVGRTFIYISFPTAMTVRWLKPFLTFPGGFVSWQKIQNLTGATPMISFRNSGTITATARLFWGTISGCIGETSAFLIILAAVYLIYTKTAKWQLTVGSLLSALLFVVLFYGANPLPFVLSGGLLFGSVFMITDPVSSPRNKYAVWIYGILVGFITIFIRKYALFTEGFMFAILIANTFMPIIEFALNKAKWK